MARLKGFLPVQALLLTVAVTQACAGFVGWSMVGVLVGLACGSTLLAALGIRAGWGVRWADPALLTLQILMNLLLVAVVYTCVPGARSVALQTMCLLLVYDMHRLSFRQMRLVSIWSVVSLLIGVAWSYGGNAGLDAIEQEVLFAVVAAGMVPAVLLVAVSGNRLRHREMTQHQLLQQTLSHLEKLSRTDSLTGLLNRRHAQHLLQEEVARTNRTGRAFALAILDIDHFKQINDRFGHVGGDEVLRHVAQLLQQTWPEPNECVARWGGEEFLIVLPEKDLEALAAGMALLQAAVRGYDWGQVDAGLTVSFSAGMGLYRQGQGLGHCLAAVDAMLYEAKNKGRDLALATEALDADRLAACHVARSHERLEADSSERHEQLQALSAPTVGTEPSIHGLLERDQSKQQLLRLALIPSLLYGVWLVLAWLWGYRMGFIGMKTALWFSAAMTLSGTVPYMLIRAGLTARFKDPWLFLPQMLIGALLTAAAYIVVPEVRPLLVQLFCHILIFGFLGLNALTSIVAGLSTGVIVCAAFWGALYWRPAGLMQWVDGVQVLASCVIIGMITMQSHRHALARVRIKERGQALEDATRRVRHLTTTDALTGLPNRDAVYAAALREFQRRGEGANSFGLALIDLDHFKRINDQHGHPVGDEALVGFTDVARHSLRAIDIVGRWGGEEFLVVLPEVQSRDDGLMPLERLRLAFAEAAVSEHVPNLRATLSAGLAIWQPGESLDSLIQRADVALYEAKHAGRNCVVTARAHPHKP